MRNVLIILFTVLILIVTSHFVIAETKVIINEFLIDPTPQAVELFNKSSENIDISGWYIDDNGGTTYYTIPQSKILYPNSCMVFTGDFNFNKSSNDMVRLFNAAAPPTSSSAQLIDSFSYKSSSGSGITYFRLPDGTATWATGFATLGKYNTNGQPCIVEPTPTLLPIPTVLTTLTDEISSTPIPSIIPTETNINYSNIYISEVMPNPLTHEHEWIELYNNNDYDVKLNNWYIDDIENGGSSAKLFSLAILSKQYGIVELSSSMFNNDTDAVRLLDANKILQDSFEYSSTKQGKSYGRTSFDNDQFCLQEPSKGIRNNPCINPSPTVTPTPPITPTLSLTKIISTVTPLIRHSSSIGLLVASPQNQPEEQGNVLGIHTPVNQQANHPVIYLSFTSFSYSLLTIISLLIKMKKGL